MCVGGDVGDDDGDEAMMNKWMKGKRKKSNPLRWKI
jgi:hypothetical protein